ncbi:hypothetical protein GM418_04330 [Maribellus comscasis]|uniref:Uncharacterized protein n=1 Tax=Maribellus comscasis TaxID=2681766 RepID=A0A6I6JP49_9BACT|nr:hypothetical protein [Maribellus comscasis]QGY42909.1 hypothetical protein GM418_04330 [Maribellus comscasis]
MKEKDYIEEIILKNLEELNDNEPQDGHFERFEAKLKSQNKKKRITLNVVWKVAAAVIFVLLAVNQVAIYMSPEKLTTKIANAKNDISLASVSEEYEEVEIYYTNAIDAGLTQWNTLSNEGFISAEEQEMMDTELAEFETRFKDLQEDLAANPNDERVINAMLEYYQTKLGIINMIVNKLEEVKQQQKNTEHEIEI